jgi:uroporphyrinogen decarboxylase
MSKRNWVLRVLNNEAVEKTPLGFWFHFTGNELKNGFEDPRMLEQCLEGHKKFYREFQPDMVKIMTDGFFIYPNEEFQNAKSAADLLKVKSIGANHPWIEKQVSFARTLTDFFGGEVLTFYNIFSPATTFKFVRLGNESFRMSERSPDTLLANIIMEDKEAAAYALDIVAKDLALLSRRVIEEGKADGIYLSTQDISDRRIDAGLHNAVIAPSDIKVLEGANGAKAADGKSLNILHICGYEGHQNNLNHFTAYPARIINWAVVFEKMPLGEGRKLFPGKAVIGGFDNLAEGILCRGSKEEVQAETRRLISESGRQGFILGADCTLPRNIDFNRLQWVREAAG